MALVPLVRFADVQKLDRVVSEHRLELVERDGLESLLAAAVLPAGNSEQPDCVQRPRGTCGFGLVRRMEEEWMLGQDERSLRREARAGDRDADGAGMVAGREDVRRTHVENDRVLRHRAEPLERGLPTE